MRPLLLTLLLILTACHQPVAPRARTASLDRAMLDRDFAAIARRGEPGVIAAAVMDMATNEAWTVNGERMMGMMSVYKAPLGAAVLARVDEGDLSLDEVITLRDTDLSPGLSPVAAAYPAVTQYTVRDLLERAVGASDNTAADVLMTRIGGPGIVQAWIQEKALEGIRIDRFEREIGAEINGLSNYHHATFEADRAAVPVAQRRAALTAYMADPRDRMSPQGAILFLSRLQRGELLSRNSTIILLSIMGRSTTGPNRIRAGLPVGSLLAHKPGTSGTMFGVTPAVNDIGVVTLPGGRRYAVAVFVSGCTQAVEACEALIADSTRLFVQAARP